MQKIKRAVKRLLQIPYTKADYDRLFLQKIRSARQFTGVNKDGNEVNFLYDNCYTLHARLWPHSDAMVLEQVIVGEEYKVVTDFFKVNIPSQQKMNIIDAGANVGYSSVFFLHEFPQATIACVEPEEHNIEQLKKNLSAFLQNGKAIILQNGLMSEGGRNIVTNKDFRDGKDWSVTVTETQKESDLKSITVEDIRKQMKWEHVDILKIDIEGAERFIFTDDADLSYLAYVKTLAIEIHDEFGIRDVVYRQLHKHGFAIFNFGETTFAVKKSLLKS